MPQLFSSTFKTFIISLLAGMLAGFLAYLAFGSGLISIPYVSQYYLSKQTLERDLVISQPRKVVVEQDLQTIKVREQARTTLYRIYPEKSAKNVLNSFYLPSEKLAEAVSLTSDGWLVSTVNLENKKIVVLSPENKVLPVVKIVFDKTTSLNFIKVNAQNLAVASLVSRQTVANGQQAILVDAFGQQLLSNIRKINYYEEKDLASAANSSEKFSRQILFNDILEGRGGVALNLSGELLGLLVGDNPRLAVPAWQIQEGLAMILKPEIKQPYLGVNYLDLNNIANSQISLAYGAWVKTIAANSPVKNILQVGDVILAVNDDSLKGNDLATEIFQYNSGDRLDLKIWRNGTEQTVNVQLGNR